MTYFESKGRINMWGNNTNINVSAEIRTKTVVISGIGITGKMFQIGNELVKKNINRVMVVTGNGSYMKTRVWDIVKKTLEEKNIDFVFYRINIPTPTVGQVDDAAEIASDFGVTSVIVIVGGSLLDTAKNTANLIVHKVKTVRDIYEFQLPAKKPAQMIALNSAH
jgi:alcohol dehydrogenase